MAEGKLGDEVEQYSAFSWSGYPAKMIKYHIEIEGKERVVLQCWTLANQTAYTLTYTSTLTQFSVFFDDVIDIIDTTTFQTND